jgi:hypothetical protein
VSLQRLQQLSLRVLVHATWISSFVCKRSLRFFSFLWWQRVFSLNDGRKGFSRNFSQDCLKNHILRGWGGCWTVVKEIRSDLAVRRKTDKFQVLKFRVWETEMHEWQNLANLHFSNRLMQSPCSLCVYVSPAPVNYWMPEPIFMKLGISWHLSPFQRHPS